MSEVDESVSQNDIAIVGMALRVPGARTVGEFWNNLRNGVESIRTLTPDELVAAGESPSKLQRSNYVPRTADLTDMEMFDADFFGLSPIDAAVMDPQHRQFLECAWEAMEDAARPPQTVAGPVGVFAGCGMGSYFYFNVCSHRDLVDRVGMFLLRHTGNDKDFLATRASFAFDLKGPSINVQTACSTSLVAVHYACHSLLSGECDMALAGGSTIELPHRRGYLFHDGEILSPDGHCRAFDHRAAGTVFGSGTGVVVLKRLSDAIADGDPIRAVIKATALNNDGASKAGYLAPSVTGQASAVVEALGLAGLSAEDIQYVECHGTGTYLGDPIEIEALTQAYRMSTTRTGFCRVGSVKTNIGHLDTAAGVVGLIKTVLALEHGEMPPSLNFEKPNPAIDFANSPFIVNARSTPWPKVTGPRRAAVNSLGVGGTNAHAIIEEAPRATVRATTGDEADGPDVIVLSAKSRKALDAAALRLGEFLQTSQQTRLEDATHTLLHGRQHFDFRRVVAVADRADAIAVLSGADGKRMQTHSVVDGKPAAIFLFPGGGAQHPGMARGLYRDEPRFRAAVDEGLSYLSTDVATKIRRTTFEAGAADAEAAKALLLPSLQLPAILIVEVALARSWMARGIQPAALIGHSMGENAAACIAGVLSFERAVKLVRLRGELFDEIRGGGMLSVPMSFEELTRRIPDELDIASVNAPSLCVVSGNDHDLEHFRLALLADGVEASRVPIDIAAHSRLLAPILGRFGDFLAQSKLSPPRIPIVSNLSGTWLTPAEATDPAYWVRHLRSTVRFAQGLAVLAQEKQRIYIEVGPGRTLSSLVKAQAVIPTNQVVNSLPHADEVVDDRLHFATAVARVWATGLAIPPEQVRPARGGQRISIPTYSFQHQRYFLERVKPVAESQPDSLAKETDLARWGWVPGWQQSVAGMQLGADAVPRSWLVVMDDAGVGRALVARLRDLRHTVVTVELGDTYSRLDAESFVVCAEHGREGYERLLQDLAAEPGIPGNIVHLGLLTSDEAFRPGSSFFDRNQERGFYSLFFLAQVLGEVGAPSPMQVTVVTNGMMRVGEEELPYPEKATVLGPAMVLPKEFAGASVRVLDVSSPPRQPPLAVKIVQDWVGLKKGSEQAATIARLIWGDLFAAPANEVAAFRDGQRWLRNYQRFDLSAGTQSDAGFKEKGVYLVTGGLGDLGLAFARRLGEQLRARLVLIGRSELPARETWDGYIAAYGSNDRLGRAIEAVKAIEAAGGEVLCASADVTNPESIREAVAAGITRFGTIDGVIHTAGTVRDSLIAMKTPGEIQEVLSPKVVGTIVLEEALRGLDLDLLVLFSSTSTDTAPAGQVDYVAANAYLNAFAQSRAGRSRTRVVALHWGVWKDVGLAARALVAGREGGPDLVVAAKAPLFDRRIDLGEQGYVLEGRWDAKRHWILDEHRLKSGDAIWPGTGYIEAFAQAAREAVPESAFVLEDVTFLRPLHIPDGQSPAIRISVQRSGSKLRMALSSEIDGSQEPFEIVHAEALARAIHVARPRPLQLDVLADACSSCVVEDSGKALPSIQERHLAFGPRWRVLRSMRLGAGQALARLALADEFAGDLAAGYGLHPALLDIATGFAMELVPGYDPAKSLWVPVSYGRLIVYRQLTSKIVSHVKLASESELGPGYATFNVVLTDDAGDVLVNIERFTIKQLDEGAELAKSINPTPGGEIRRRQPGNRSLGEKSPAMERLTAQVAQGILPDQGFEAMMRALKTGQPEVVISSMDLLQLKRAAERVDEAAAAGSGFERPDLDSEYEPPRNDIERQLVAFWSELLGIEKIGINDNFFDLGGHSLNAVRLFRMIKKELAADLPISVLLEAPTIAQCAALIEAAGGGKAADEAASPGGGASKALPLRRFTHLVPMAGMALKDQTPFFICAGMFGNVLNLRHLSVNVGQDRPVYGLQARGLFGDQAPHETFEEMASANLAEVRQVQPHGPYLLGGFSGGGLVAFEMAKQLRSAGEEVGTVILLDTPYPEKVELSIADRIAIRTQDVRKKGAAFFPEWVKLRIEYEIRQRMKRREGESLTGEQLHNQVIEGAFYQALSRYQGSRYDGHAILLRPRLQVAYQLLDGRELNADRGAVHNDNGWSPYIAELSILEVPGDHDSMVLEPNIRVVASHIRRALDGAQAVSFGVAAE